MYRRRQFLLVLVGTLLAAASVLSTFAAGEGTDLFTDADVVDESK